MNTRKLSVTLFSILCISVMLNGYAYAAGEEIRVKFPDDKVLFVANFTGEDSSFSYTIENLGDCDVIPIKQFINDPLYFIDSRVAATPGEKIRIIQNSSYHWTHGLMCECDNWDDDRCEFIVTDLKMH